MGCAAPDDVRRRGALSLLRSARPRGRGGSALRRPSMGRRRRGRRRRELAGTGRSAVLHGDTGHAARREPPPSLPNPRPHHHGNQRRSARRLARGCGWGGRLPARGARARTRHADARHRRDDPGRPVRAHRTRARAGSRHPGRAGYREDGSRSAPRVLFALRTPGVASAHPRRRPEPDVHGLRLARPAVAGRGQRRAARGRRARRGRRRDAAGLRGRRATEGRPAPRRGREAGGRASLGRTAGGARAPTRGTLRRGGGRRGRHRSCGRREPSTASPRQAASASE